jgi:4'-phosphopantetheinyl transferase
LLKLYYTEALLEYTDEKALMQAIDDVRRTKITHRQKKDRIASAAAAVLLRYALCDSGYSQTLGTSIDWEGKPHFADPSVPLCFNLSHTTDRASGKIFVVLALSDEGEVGVDTELPHAVRNRDALMQRLYLPHERRYIADAENDTAFFEIWCAKEAYMKWTGEGFLRNPSTISVSVDGQYAVSDGLRCDLRWMTAGDAVICVAGECLPERIETLAVSAAELTVI